ncbi:MAG: preprotein translocase subunit SecG [Bdellovibrio sp.]|nr:preprotein translocase subunit SecG [Bdellovibrio sp.]
MVTFFTVIHIVCCALLILLVLIQSGKGAEISASFGGSSQTVFGSSGGANFFTRLTTGVATVFMITSVLLTIASNKTKQSIMEGRVSQRQTTTNTPSPSGAPVVIPPAAPATSPTNSK